MGQELLGDGQTCITPEAFLLYTRGHDIRRISLETTTNNDVLVPVRGVSAPAALELDVSEGRIYWTDLDTKVGTMGRMLYGCCMNDLGMEG